MNHSKFLARASGMWVCPSLRSREPGGGQQSSRNVARGVKVKEAVSTKHSFAHFRLIRILVPLVQSFTSHSTLGRAFRENLSQRLVRMANESFGIFFLFCALSRCCPPARQRARTYLMVPWRRAATTLEKPCTWSQIDAGR